MATFRYRAATAAGSVQSGRLAAVNLQELEARLKLLGLELIDARAQRSARDRRAAGGAVPRRELIAFCIHMETTLAANLHLVDALSDLAEAITHQRFAAVVSVVLDSVRGGKTLSEALREHPAVFDRVFVGMVESGERSGRYDEVFARLGANLKWEEEVLATTKKALMYPAFTLSVLLAVALFLLIYLVPQLSGFIRDQSGGKLPLQTQILLWMSDFLVADWWVLILVPALLAAAWFWITRFGSEQTRVRIDAWRLRIPLVGPVLMRVSVSRFAGLFGMLYASGLPVLDAIRVAEEAVSNLAIRSDIAAVRARISQGMGITEAFSRSPHIPGLMLRMVRIGEATGDIEKSMGNVTYIYEREIRTAIERIEAMAEPVLTVALGLMLGWLMTAVLGPVYDLLSKIKT